MFSQGKAEEIREEGETSSLHVEFLKNIFLFDSFDEVLGKKCFYVQISLMNVIAEPAR